MTPDISDVIPRSQVETDEHIEVEVGIFLKVK